MSLFVIFLFLKLGIATWFMLSLLARPMDPWEWGPLSPLAIDDYPQTFNQGYQLNGVRPSQEPVDQPQGYRSQYQAHDNYLTTIEDPAAQSTPCSWAHDLYDQSRQAPQAEFCLADRGPEFGTDALGDIGAYLEHGGSDIGGVDTSITGSSFFTSNHLPHVPMPYQPSATHLQENMGQYSASEILGYGENEYNLGTYPVSLGSASFAPDSAQHATLDSSWLPQLHDIVNDPLGDVALPMINDDDYHLHTVKPIPDGAPVTAPNFVHHETFPHDTSSLDQLLQYHEENLVREMGLHLTHDPAHNNLNSQSHSFSSSSSKINPTLQDYHLPRSFSNVQPGDMELHAMNHHTRPGIIEMRQLHLPCERVQQDRRSLEPKNLFHEVLENLPACEADPKEGEAHTTEFLDYVKGFFFQGPDSRHDPILGHEHVINDLPVRYIFRKGPKPINKNYEGFVRPMKNKSQVLKQQDIKRTLKIFLPKLWYYHESFILNALYPKNLRPQKINMKFFSTDMMERQQNSLCEWLWESVNHPQNGIPVMGLTPYKNFLYNLFDQTQLLFMNLLTCQNLEEIADLTALNIIFNWYKTDGNRRGDILIDEEQLWSSIKSSAFHPGFNA